MKEGLEQGDGGGHGGSVAKKTAALRHKDSLLGCDAVSAGALARGGLLRGACKLGSLATLTPPLASRLAFLRGEQDGSCPTPPVRLLILVGSEKICG